MRGVSDAAVDGQSRGHVVVLQELLHVASSFSELNLNFGTIVSCFLNIGWIYANYSSEMALEIYNGRLPIVLID